MAATAATPKRKTRSTIVGKVTSAHKTPKTIRVEVDYLVRHPKYGKYLRRFIKLLVHDEKGEARQGDVVEVMECRPISKTKSWRLVRVVQAAPRD
jgi:small subunit ribosomal protein S17